MQLPQSLLDDLHAVPGFNEQEFIDAHQENIVTSIRLHPIKGSGTAVGDQESVPWCSGGTYLKERPVFTLDPAYHAGAYYVQEASSMFLAHLFQSVVSKKEGLRVLDLCAAPGGKSTLLASLLREDSLLITNDVIRSRASILEENMVRWGYTNSWVTCNDPKDFGALTGYFDVIIVDAPCSGSGLFRKDANALMEWSEANVALCSGRQQRILADIWPALKQDGILIYATCSFSPQENEQILDFLAAEYDIAALKAPLQNDWGIVEVTSPLKRITGYRFFPGKVRGEGFFIAGVRKNEATGSLRPIRFKPQNTNKIHQLAGYLLQAKEVQYIQPGKETYSAIHPAHEADWLLLQKALYFRKAGLPLGAPTAKEWIPAHDIALSLDASFSLPSISVNKEIALKFLKREELNIAAPAKGWQLIKFNNLGLGWVKSLETRVNNYLPKHWRIRMELPENDSIV